MAALVTLKNTFLTLEHSSLIAMDFSVFPSANALYSPRKLPSSRVKPREWYIIDFFALMFISLFRASCEEDNYASVDKKHG